MKLPRPRLTYANVVSSLALFASLGGVSYAATTLPKGSVGPKQIRAEAVRNGKIADGAVTAVKLAQGVRERLAPVGGAPAVTTTTSTPNDKVEVANSNGTTATPLVVTEHGVHPSWSPDSGKIAFSYLEQVYTTVADGSALPTPVAGATGNEPVWSPDGSRIAFGEHVAFATVNLGIISPNGGTPVTLTSGAQFIFASWSPSGSQVVYHASGGGEDTHWRVANADGSGDHVLPEFPSLNPNGPAPSWSPSGNRIVYQGFYFGSEPHTNAVYVENTDGSGSVTPLTGDQGFSTYPSWRPSPSAAPQVFTPTSASGTPAAQALPVTLPKPTTVWFTKRIFVTKGPDLTVIIGSYGCDGPSCGVSTEGKAKYAGPPAGLLASSARTRTRQKHKPRQVVVAKGKTTIAGGKSGPVKMKLTKAGIKLLGKQGSLKIAVVVTITIPGQKKIVEHRQVTVVLKKAKRKCVAA